MSDRLSLRSLSLSLAAVLVCGGLTANLRSADAAPPVVAAEDSDSTSVMAEAQSSGHRVEDVEQRTETTQVFANPDGTWTSEIATTPVRVQDSSGSWEQVDLTLEERDGVIVPKASATEVAFSVGGDRMLAQVSEDGKDLAWRLPGSDAVLPEPVLDGPTATYPDIAPGQDLIVTATPTGFSHSVILRERPDLAPGESLDIAMPVTTDGTKLTETAQGGLTLTTNSGEFVAGAPQPMMWDSSEGPSGQSENVAPVDVTVTQPGGVTPEGNTAGSSPVVTLSPDESFLTDPDTQYPVTVDPTYSTTSNGDTWAQNLDFTSSQAGSDELRAGTFDSGTHKARSWLRFDTAPLNGKKINSATMSLLNWWSQTCSGSAVRVSRVLDDWVAVPTAGRPPVLAWNNQPSVTYTNAADSSIAKGYSSSCPGGFVGWDVTTIVQGWADGSFANHGFRVNAVNEAVNSGWRRYRSTNYASNNPTLAVNYNSYPSTPTNLSIGENANNTVSVPDPTLAARVSDPDGGNAFAKFRILDVDGNEVWAGTGATAAAAGAMSTTTVDAGSISADNSYTLEVRTSDGALESKAAASIAFDTLGGQTSVEGVTVGGDGWITYNDDTVENDLDLTPGPVEVVQGTAVDDGCEFPNNIGQESINEETITLEVGYNPQTCEQRVQTTPLTEDAVTTINEMDAIEQSQSVDMADTTSVDGSHYYSSNSSSELTGTEREAAASRAYSNTESIKARWIDPVNIQITALRLKLDWWWVGGLHGGKFTAHAWAWDPNVAGIHFDQTHIGPFLWHDYENADTFMKIGVKVNFYNKTFAKIVAELLGKPGWIVCGSYKSPRADFSHDLMLAGGAGGWAADKAINKKSGACTNLVHQKTTDTFSPSPYPAR